MAALSDRLLLLLPEGMAAMAAPAEMAAMAETGVMAPMAVLVKQGGREETLFQVLAVAVQVVPEQRGE